MRVMYKYEDFDLFGRDKCYAYYVEVPKKEMTDELYELFNTEEGFIFPSDFRNGEYFEKVNEFAEGNPELATIDCIYILVDRETLRVKNMSSIFPLCWSMEWL